MTNVHASLVFHWEGRDNWIRCQRPVGPWRVQSLCSTFFSFLQLFSRHDVPQHKHEKKGSSDQVRRRFLFLLSRLVSFISNSQSIKKKKRNRSNRFLGTVCTPPGWQTRAARVSSLLSQLFTFSVSLLSCFLNFLSKSRKEAGLARLRFPMLSITLSHVEHYPCTPTEKKSYLLLWYLFRVFSPLVLGGKVWRKRTYGCFKRHLAKKETINLIALFSRYFSPSQV